MITLWKKHATSDVWVKFNTLKEETFKKNFPDKVEGEIFTIWGSEYVYYTSNINPNE